MISTLVTLQCLYRTCFTQSDLQDLLNKFRVNSCGVVDVTTFSLILMARASCITREDGNYKEAAELKWKIEKLVTALELRNEYL